MRSLMILPLAAMLCSSVFAADAKPKILFLNKSAGFQHDVIKQKDGQPSLTDTTLDALAKKLGGTVTSTKDASLINADNLKKYDLVIFYTTGDLTTPGTDKTTPMGPNGVAELIDWVKNGGGFMGFHCADDTFHPTPNCSTPPTPYIDMIGGEFKTHGQQFEGTVKLVSPEHPTMAHLKDGWKVTDEWYVHCNMNTKNIHVLALLDPGDEAKKQDKYNIPPYPCIWCRELGKGRVYYNAMGHREDVWQNPIFQSAVTDAINWTTGQGPAQAEPNYDKAVPVK